MAVKETDIITILDSDASNDYKAAQKLQSNSSKETKDIKKKVKV